MAWWPPWVRAVPITAMGMQGLLALAAARRPPHSHAATQDVARRQLEWRRKARPAVSTTPCSAADVLGTAVAARRESSIGVWTRPALDLPLDSHAAGQGDQVPSLEHNNQVKGESLELVKYIDSNFEGPSLLPEDPAKKQFAEELLAYTDAFIKAVYISVLSKQEAISEESVAALDKIEEALGKFNDGPFFLGQFSLVDIAYVTFVEHFQILLSNIKNYDITKGRPNLQKFIEEMNKIDAYTRTKQDPQLLVERAKKHFGIA